MSRSWRRHTRGYRNRDFTAGISDLILVWKSREQEEEILLLPNEKADGEKS